MPEGHRIRAVQSQDGFTLIEISIALAIAGLVMAMLVPNMAPAIARARLYSATRDVASALRHARGQAVVRGEEALFELDTRFHHYRLTGSRKVHVLPEDIKLGLYTSTEETTEPGAGRIRFYPDGSSTGGRVTLIAGGLEKRIDINWLTGVVSQDDAMPHDD